MLETKDENDPARSRRLVVAVTLAVAITGACVGGDDAPPAQDETRDSTVNGLAHANGAVLDVASPPATPHAGAAAANGSPNGGSFTGTAPGLGGVDEKVGPAGAPARAGRAGSAAVAPTPDELSALAATLVVPVAGVTRAELRSSFTALRGGGTRQHNALDIPAPRGTPVIAATPGRVLRLFSSKAGGLMVYAADATERFILMYGHLDRYADGLKDGMPLARGQTIGYVGTTGNAPANVPHLHFAIARTNNVDRWWNGTPVDPAPLFNW